jgi:hypothetical protein
MLALKLIIDLLVNYFIDAVALKKTIKNKMPSYLFYFTTVTPNTAIFTPDKEGVMTF